MEYTVHVGKTGGSLRITLPEPFCQALSISKGDALRITLEGSSIVVRKA